MHCIFFSLLLFKANGSEREHSAVTQAEIDDLERIQMEKVALAGPVAQQPQGLLSPDAIHSLLCSQEPGKALCEHRAGVLVQGACARVKPTRVMGPRRWYMSRACC